MSRRFKFKVRQQEEESFGINVIPMIDLVTILNAFLLVSAAFFAFGQIQVEIPFLSTKLPDTEQLKKNQVALNVIMDEGLIKIELRHSINTKKHENINIKKSGGIYDWESFHYSLVDIKQRYPQVRTMTLFPDEEVAYKDMIELLDAARDIKPDDPPLVTRLEDGTEVPANFLFRNVVIGGVLL